MRTDRLNQDSIGREIASGRQVVVLLHGLARRPSSMAKLARALADAGYVPVNHGYPSRKHTIEELVDSYLKPLLDTLQAAGASRIHFVTHSLGGILLRQYVRRHGAALVGRAVLIAPPNHGSEIADRLRPLGLFRRFYGPAGQQLGTTSDQLPGQLPDADFDVGVIAGTRNWNPIFKRWLPGPSDGTVSVESTRLGNSTGFIAIPATHLLIIRHPQAIALTLHFLANGSFDPAGNSRES